MSGSEKPEAAIGEGRDRLCSGSFVLGSLAVAEVFGWWGRMQAAIRA